MKMKLLRLLGSSVALSGLFAASSASAITYTPGVNVGTGATQQVRGIANSDGSRAFLGVPYALPPVGNLRWRAPADIPPWVGVKDTFKFGNRCIQAADRNVDSSNPIPISEDCLYLNVYTPPVSSITRPVMVFIHGGFLWQGAGSDLDGAKLANKTNTIVVTFNYRLGAQGLLALDALSAEGGGTSGNYALLDQNKALKWVRDNIAKFGGDKNNVTLFGESAGAGSVLMHMAMPMSAGLFHKGIAQSLPALGTIDKAADAKQKGNTYSAQSMGCNSNDLVCLRSKSIVIGNPMDFNPNLDGQILTKPLSEVFKSGQFNRVPVIIGSNSAEGKLAAATYEFMPTLNRPTPGPTTLTEYNSYDTNKSPLLALAALNNPWLIWNANDRPNVRYPANSYASPALAAAAVLGDATISCPSEYARNILQPFVTVYGYEFTDPNAPNSVIPSTIKNPLTGATLNTFPSISPSLLPIGSTHMSELPYVFQASASDYNVATKSSYGFSTAQSNLINAMGTYWGAFAYAGTPNFNFGLPSWPAYTGAAPAVQALNVAGISTLASNLLPPPATQPTSAPNGVVNSFFVAHKCDYWINSTAGLCQYGKLCLY